ncbi:hypothetical protein DAPPUDRAFT_263295 [Daphnia pulex]|uniref:Uncharacterized protein n=1 Tax=Daphnia pulex TaxID=6669 RepID=E9HPH3_DAPPU|nr:hypothetical protein DAPPUDRAFT_263295 [Daphnia pulex]|eukprot:EFX66362.1 hypothetical protein DAPPUDRAFT_263295 [Daphnia pulex]
MLLKNQGSSYMRWPINPLSRSSSPSGDAIRDFILYISQKIGDLPRMMERPQSKDGFGGAGKTAKNNFKGGN